MKNLRPFPKHWLLFIPLLQVLAGPPGPAAAEPLGARPQGMGRAFTAVAGDINSLFFNPAGLSGLDRPAASAMYGKLYWGLTDESQLYEGLLALGYPLPHLGAAAAGWTSSGVSNFYVENHFKIGYGGSLRALGPDSILAGMALGAAVNLYVYEVVDNEYVRLSSSIVRLSQSGASLDVGWQFAASPQLRLAATVKDILEPNLNFTADDENRLPLQAVVGLAYTWEALDALLTTADIAAQDGIWKFLLGAEKWFYGRRLGVRAGLGGYSAGESYGWNDASAGCSYAWPAGRSHICADYAFVVPLAGIEGTAGSHRIAISMQW